MYVTERVAKLEIAVTRDSTFVLSSEAAPDIDETDLFREIPGGDTTQRVDLEVIGAQFHLIDVPRYQDPRDAVLGLLYDSLDLVNDHGVDLDDYRRTLVSHLNDALDRVKEIER